MILIIVGSLKTPRPIAQFLGAGYSPSMREFDQKWVDIQDLDTLAQSVRGHGLKIVSTNGCFDLLHLGHIEYLQQARALGDVLVIGINSDASVKRLKGDNRPLFDARTRSRQLAALEAVDYVTVFDEDTPVEFLELLRPDIHVKGGDYEVAKLPETAVVEKHGGEVRVLSFVKGFSSTKVLDALSLKGLSN